MAGLGGQFLCSFKLNRGQGLYRFKLGSGGMGPWSSPTLGGSFKPQSGIL